MCKSTAVLIGAMAFCSGLVVGLLAMSSEIEAFKKDKIQAETARRKIEAEQKGMWEKQLELKTELNKAKYRNDELAKEIDGLKGTLREIKKENTNGNNQLHKESTAVDEEKQWTEIARWTGKGAKTTDTFHISSNTWRISWVTRPRENTEYSLGLLQIYVLKSDGSLFNIAANVIGEDKDSSVLHGSGDYYLTINTDQPYIVVVETK
jgi:hypothetical protein